MKTFLVVENQGNGCDYTIGCGVRTYTVKAESYEALLEEAREIIRGNEDDFGYHHPLAGALAEINLEFTRDSVTVYEVAVEHSIDLDTFREIVERRRQADADEEKEAKEREELKRLQEKFG